MLARLTIGLLKGLLLGGVIGAGVELALRWPLPSGGLLAFLFAMGVAGTTGIFAGRPPWREGAWIEALLKGLVGVGVGALLYWLGSRYATGPSFALPAVNGIEPLEASPWTGHAVIVLPVIAAIYGALVELDNGTDESSGKGGKTTAKGPRARVAEQVAEADTEIAMAAPDRTRPARGKRA